MHSRTSRGTDKGEQNGMLKHGGETIEVLALHRTNRAATGR